MSAAQGPSAFHTPEAADTPHPAGAGMPPRRVIDSTDLLGRERQVEIVHQGQVYRLQATRLGKLILTK